MNHNPPETAQQVVAADGVPRLGPSLGPQTKLR